MTKISELDYEDYSLCVDYIRGVSMLPFDTINDFLCSFSEVAGLDVNDFKIGTGRLFYSKGAYFQDKNFIFFAWNETSQGFLDLSSHNPGVLVSISGDGCRFIGDKLRNVVDFLGIDFKCTRIDVTCDLFNGDTGIVELFCEAFNNSLKARCRSSFNRNMVYREALNRGDLFLQTRLDPFTIQHFFNHYPITGEITPNYEIGNSSSELGMFRLYDKKYEVLYSDRGIPNAALYEACGSPDYWYRFEFQNMGVHAAKRWYDLFGGVPLNILFYDSLNEFFTIREEISSGYKVAQLPSSPLFDEFVALFWEVKISRNSGDYVSMPYITDFSKTITYCRQQFPTFFKQVLLSPLFDDFDFSAEFEAMKRTPKYSEFFDEYKKRYGVDKSCLNFSDIIHTFFPYGSKCSVSCYDKDGFNEVFVNRDDDDDIYGFPVSTLDDFILS